MTRRIVIRYEPVAERWEIGDEDAIGTAAIGRPGDADGGDDGGDDGDDAAGAASAADDQVVHYGYRDDGSIGELVIDAAQPDASTLSQIREAFGTEAASVVEGHDGERVDTSIVVALQPSLVGEPGVPELIRSSDGVEIWSVTDRYGMTITIEHRPGELGIRVDGSSADTWVHVCDHATGHLIAAGPLRPSSAAADRPASTAVVAYGLDVALNELYVATTDTPLESPGAAAVRRGSWCDQLLTEAKHAAWIRPRAAERAAARARAVAAAIGDARRARLADEAAQRARRARRLRWGLAGVVLAGVVALVVAIRVGRGGSDGAAAPDVGTPPPTLSQPVSTDPTTATQPTTASQPSAPPPTATQPATTQSPATAQPATTGPAAVEPEDAASALSREQPTYHFDERRMVRVRSLDLAGPYRVGDTVSMEIIEATRVQTMSFDLAGLPPTDDADRIELDLRHRCGVYVGGRSMGASASDWLIETTLDLVAVSTDVGTGGRRSVAELGRLTFTSEFSTIEVLAEDCAAAPISSDNTLTVLHRFVRTPEVHAVTVTEALEADSWELHIRTAEGEIATADHPLVITVTS